MTKRTIDADKLLGWVKATKGLFDDETLDDFYQSTIEKINELSLDVPKQYVDVNVLKSQLLKITFPRQYGYMPYYKQIMDKIQSVIGSITTPAPEPQEIFDADGWFDIKIAPHCTPLIVYDHVNKLAAVSTYRPSYSSNKSENWRDAWDYSKGIGFIPTMWRRPLPKEVYND